MKVKLRIACAAILATAATPAWALQLGQIQVKSALNQPLVAAIPLHPKNLNELDGLAAALAPAADFTRAGLKLTATDRTLRFHVVTDDNGQKLILVTSSEPVTEPYLDFLLEVDSRQGKQVREFVVLLNPVIQAPAPHVAAAQAGAPAASEEPIHGLRALPQAPLPIAPEPATLEPRPLALASRSVEAERTIRVPQGDTLYHVAQQQTQGTTVSVNQMMLALEATNPDAFFKPDINSLKAGAILRIPGRAAIDARTVAEADAEVRRQYQRWRAARPHPATVVEGAAAEAVAKAPPAAGNESVPTSDHLALVPPAGKGAGGNSHPGVAGGTGSEKVTDLQQRLQNDQATLVSLKQANADLESRVHSLEDLSKKTNKLLSLKDATIAELQRKLAAVESGKASGSASPAARAGGGAATAAAAAGAKVRQAKGATSKPAAAQAHASVIPWYRRPWAWGTAGLIALVLILIGLLQHRRGGSDPATVEGPLPEPGDAVPAWTDTDKEASLQATLAEDPSDLAAHLALCQLYYARCDSESFVAAATDMHEYVSDPYCPEWCGVVAMGEELAPDQPLFASPLEAPIEDADDPQGAAALRPSVESREIADAPPLIDVAGSTGEPVMVADAAAGPVHGAETQETWDLAAQAAGVDGADDPVDAKLDLARACLDMEDAAGARALLEEVIAEGSQVQKDAAERLRASVVD